MSSAPCARGHGRRTAPSPAATSGLFEVFRRRYLLKLLVRREISARYQGSFLGLFWSYLQPASRLAMYYFVFGILLARPIENFAIHLFAGLVIVHYFTETFSSGTRSIVRNKGVVQKMAVPREMFPVASMLVSAYHVIPGLVLLTGLRVAGLDPRPGRDRRRAARVPPGGRCWARRARSSSAWPTCSSGTSATWSRC